MKTKPNKSMQKFIKEALLLEAKEIAEFLVKLNYDALKKEHPEMHPKELHKLAKEGPKYRKHIINFINNFDRPGGYERHFIKWAGDQMQLYGMFNADYIYDWYLGDENAKNILNSISYRSAMENAHIWHDELKQKNFDSEIADEGKTKTVYKFSNGSKIVELSWEDCDAEGDSMGHCVGTMHTKLVKDGKEKIFSLRGETNKPHVTISVDPKTNKVLEIKGRENKVPVEKHAKLIKEWLKTTNFDYVSCVDYFNILSMNEKKEMLQTAKEKNIKSYFNLIFNKLINKDINLSKQDLSKITLGAAMSCVHLVPEVEKTKELLSVVRDWTNGNAGDEQIKIVYNELSELCRTKVAAVWPVAAATAACDAAEGCQRFSPGTAVIWATNNAKQAGIPEQEIISSIEKEIGMPLENFLFKNEVNESLIKSFIKFYS